MVEGDGLGVGDAEPLETLSFTVEFLSTLEPSPGSTAVTWPLGWLPLTSSTVTVRPRALS